MGLQRAKKHGGLIAMWKMVSIAMDRQREQFDNMTQTRHCSMFNLVLYLCAAIPM
jgi:hypothetical protein